MSSKKIYPVILCGGSGTRLWPLSRKSFPKQFLSLNSQTPFPYFSKRKLELTNLEIFLILFLFVTKNIGS